MFKDIFKNKKVLITGHTGFKGAWLSSWLVNMGANVAGLSKDIPTKPSLFEILNLENKLSHYIADVRNLSKVEDIFSLEQPDFVFHLAAQPIVSQSYVDPIETISTNSLGTATLLQVLRGVNHSCVAVFITSDKSYDNVEQVWGYKENDILGGKDIYSGSKAAAEMIINSYYHSFFNNQDTNVRLAVARAGNVIGGGDWAKDRIVVDCMKAWSEKKKVSIRCPRATRPWQHVLEPLSGYLTLAAMLFSNKKNHGESFNFGPKAEQNNSVIDLLASLSKVWGYRNADTAYSIDDDLPFNESGLLKLNCDKALASLDWVPTLNYQETVEFTGKWYLKYFTLDGLSMWDFTVDQINLYQEKAQARSVSWMA